MSQFRRNYLPSQTQPWAREVQQRVVKLESSLRTEFVNNRTRDDQLASSYNRLDSAFVDLRVQQDSLQAVVDNIYTPGTEQINGAKLANGTVGASKIVANSITSNQIAADTITTNEISSNYVYAGTISANQINAGTLSADRIFGGTISGNNVNVINLSANSITTGSFSADRISGGTITASNISGVTISGVSITGSNFLSGGNVEVPFGTIFGADINADDYRGRRHSQVGNTTTSSFAGNVFINSSGFMFRSTNTSSQEAKENIAPYVFDTKSFLAVSPVTFNYKTEAVFNPEEANIKQLGFIVEDFESAGLGEFLTIPANEVDKYKGLRYDKLYMLLHKSVQDINNRLETLENNG